MEGKIYWTPQEAGCWYCNKRSGDLVFSHESDSYVHVGCVRDELENDPRDEEARRFADELGI